MGKTSVESDTMFRISLPGKDVNSNRPEDFAVHSGFDYPKIEEAYEGYVVITMPDPIVTGYTDLVVIRHDYGYKPFAIAFLDDVDNSFTTNFAQLPFSANPILGVTFLSAIDEFYFKIQYYNGSGSNINSGPDVSAGNDMGFKYQVWVNE